MEIMCLYWRGFVTSRVTSQSNLQSSNFAYGKKRWKKRRGVN